VLFYGDYLHSPNSDAALRLIRAIMPRVRQTHPEAVLELVGAHHTREMAASAGSSDVIRGVVPSLTPYLDRATVVVAPLRIGGGMRVKVLEALAAGKALVASPRALEGLDVEPGRDALRAETDEDFCAAISELIENEELRVALGSNGRTWAEANLGAERGVSAYEALYQELLSADN
jgi:glycosyltransferase involved in cell wall biosynthesis